MLEFYRQTEFISAVGATLNQPERSEHRSRAVKALQSAEAAHNVAFLEDGLHFPEVDMDHRGPEVQQRMFGFLDETYMVLDGHSAQLFDVIINGVRDIDGVSTRGWGLLMSDWLALREPNAYRPTPATGYLDFYIDCNAAVVIKDYSIWIKEFINIIYLKEKNRGSGPTIRCT